KITYKSYDNREIKEFGISVWDKNENRIISLSSVFKNQLSEYNSSGSIFCEIPSLPLVRGLYTLNCFVSSIFGIEDYIENILEFSVEENDIFGTGRTINPEWGMIAV